MTDNEDLRGQIASWVAEAVKMSPVGPLRSTVDCEEMPGEEAVELMMMQMCNAMEVAMANLAPSVLAGTLEDGDAQALASAFVRDCLPDIIVIELLDLAVSEARR
jgi:hypothetical protein